VTSAEFARHVASTLKVCVDDLEVLDREVEDDFVRDALSLLRRSLAQIELYVEKVKL